MRAKALSRLIFDQMLRALRAVNFWTHHPSSCFPRWPSIHPQASATSSASAYVTDAALEPFVANFNQTPGDDAWCAASHAAQTRTVANERIGKALAGALG